ncbi:MAG: hypothetical protein PHT77_08930 [Bacteroidales bacterium]|jgi:hypothetical protein|nr:hypothetical protein [Bacteroidales bacterium]
MAFASPKMVTQYLYLIDNVIDVNFKNLKCRSQENGVTITYEMEKVASPPETLKCVI